MSKKKFFTQSYDDDDYAPIGSKSNSSTSWETSYFGGYWRVIASLPRLESKKITVEKPFEVHGKSLLAYEIRKLTLNLLDLATTEKKMTFPYTERYFVDMLEGQPTTMVEKTLVPSGIADAITKLEKHELGNLFNYYDELLKQLIIRVTEPAPPGKCPKGMPQNSHLKGDGDGDETKGKGKSKSGGDDEGEEPGKGSGLQEYIGKGGSIDLSGDIDSPAIGWGDSSSKNMKTSFNFFPNKTHKTQYSAEQEFHASSLRDQLDIDFRPKSDKIHNLRNGKLETNKLSELVAGNPYAYHIEQEDVSYEPFSVCILADESGSMWHQPYELEHDGRIRKKKMPTTEPTYNIAYQAGMLKMFKKCFSGILKPTDLYIYGHSGESDCVISVYQDPLSMDFDQNIAVIEQYIHKRGLTEEMNRGIGYLHNTGASTVKTAHIGQQNYDGYALEAIYERVRSFTKDNILFIYLSDGMPNNTGEMTGIQKIKTVSEKLRRDKVIVAGIGVGPYTEHIKNLYHYNTIVDFTDVNLTIQRISNLINTVVKQELATFVV